MKTFAALVLIGVCMAGCCPDTAVAQGLTLKQQEDKPMKEFPGWTVGQFTDEFKMCVEGLKHEALCGCLVANIAKAMPPGQLETAKIMSKEELKAFMNEIVNQCIAGKGSKQ
jgi:hypothetical protein